MQGQYQFFPDKIIAPLKDHNELISAGAEDRAVLENVADHLACAANVIIARFVAKSIVDHLEAVDIADNNCKSIYCPVFNGGIQLLLFQKKSMFALHSGQRIS